MPTMLMVSCRKDFWSATEFSAADEIRSVDLGSGASQVATRDQFVQQIQGLSDAQLTDGDYIYILHRLSARQGAIVERICWKYRDQPLTEKWVWQNLNAIAGAF